MLVVGGTILAQVSHAEVGDVDTEPRQIECTKRRKLPRQVDSSSETADVEPRHKHERRLPAKAVVRPLAVVDAEPVVGERLELVDRVEQVGIEDLLR